MCNSHHHAHNVSTLALITCKVRRHKYVVMQAVRIRSACLSIACLQQISEGHEDNGTMTCGFFSGTILQVGHARSRLFLIVWTRPLTSAMTTPEIDIFGNTTETVRSSYTASSGFINGHERFCCGCLYVTSSCYTTEFSVDHVP
jgi:hypothetical protein